jgi:hypothetical protein
MIKMKRISVLLACGGFFLATSAAQAVPVLSVVWGQTNSATIDISTQPVSNIVTANLVLDSDSIGVTAIFLSITYDPTELAFVAGGELASVALPGMGNSFSPITPGVFDDGLGLISKFDTVASAGQPGLLGVDGPRTLGSIQFHVISGSGLTGENDVLIGLLDPTFDVIGIQGTARCAPTGVGPGPGGCSYVGADITGPVPEPTTAILLNAGIAGLGYAGRRSIR